MAGGPLSTAFCDALARFGSRDGEEPSKKGTGGKPNVRAPGVAGAADDADFDGAGIAAAESAWPEAA